MNTPATVARTAFALCAACISPRFAIGQAERNPAVVRSDDGRAVLLLARPAPNGVTIRLIRLPDDSDPSEATGTHYRVEPIALRLSAPAHLAIETDSSGYPGGAAPDGLVVMRERDRQWIATPHDTRGAVIIEGGDFAVLWQTKERCAGAKARALDFRIGVWDYRAKGYDPGRTTVTRDASGCALRESYVDIKGGRSASLFIFTVRDSLWHVTTYDPGGRSVMAGRIEPDGVAFYHSPGDREVYLRRTDSTVGFSGERSADGGKTWLPWATATYTRVPSDSGR
jgi:hypothetical protein